MRLVFWNCNMGLHNKLPALMSLKPDVAVLPECAKPDIVRSKAPLLTPESFVWIGENPQKGLGIVGFGDFGVSLAACYEPAYRFIAPCHVTGPVELNVIGVWDRHSGSEKMGRSPGPMMRSLEVYGDFILATATVVGGDFNNHVVFDKPNHVGNFAALHQGLAAFGLFSTYHAHHGVALGMEPDPTHYWRDRKRDGWRYHIDHVYAPTAWRDALVSHTVADFDSWIKLSDHMPLVVDFDETLIRADRTRDGKGIM